MSDTTIKVKPTGIAPTYNETIVVLESVNIIETDFKWLVSIYKGVVGDADYELISTLSIVPNPGGFGVVDFHRHIENYISTSFYPADVDKVSNKVTNEGFKWTYEVTESYNNTTTLQVLTSAEKTIHSFNGALSFQGFRNWNSSDYLMSTTSVNTTKFLLSGSRSIDVSLSDRVWINNFLDTVPNNGIKIVTDNGTYLTTQSHTPSGQHFINQNKIGAKDILESTDSFFSAGNPNPPIDLNTTFIKISAVDGTGVDVSEIITLNIKDYCSKYELISFFYMDKLGSYLPITFNKVSKTNIENNRSNYKQNSGSYDSVSNAYGYTSYDRGSTTYDLTSKEVVTCTSDWLSEDTANMVLDMLSSPNVYIQNEAGEYIAINITTNTYEAKKTVNEKLINYTISFEYANNNTNQRG